MPASANKLLKEPSTCLMHRYPSQAPSSSLPFSSTTAGTTPKNGSVAEPGFCGEQRSSSQGSGQMR